VDGELSDDPGTGEGLDDGADLDLTPRTGPSGRGPAARRRRRNPLAWAVLALVAVGIGLVVFQGLGNATLYFRNADEAVAQRDSLGTRRFRLQGLVTTEPASVGDTVEFDVTYNETTVHVVHRGDPPELFREGLPVVLEGHFADGSDTFQSDRILVKHSETYESEHTDRVTDASNGRDG
jgi:cytochrome c-type biogenesis protein CcmE